MNTKEIKSINLENKEKSMKMSREHNIERQLQIADELNEIQSQRENPQSPEECDPAYRTVVLVPQQDYLLRELERLQNELKDL